MTAQPINVHQTLSLAFETFLMKQRRIALGGLLLGALVIAISDSGSSRDQKSILAGIILIVAALSFIIYAHYRRSNPKKPAFEFSPAGIRTWTLVNTELLIPWNEVEGVETTDLTFSSLIGHPFVTHRDVTVLLVSRRYFDARIKVGSMWKRSPFWSAYFVAKGNQVQIAVLHELFSMTPEEMRAGVEQRWRAFSNHPNAKRPSVPHEFGKTAWWPARWRPSPAVKRLALLACVFVALPAIYFWHWLVLSWSFPQINSNGGSFYLRDLLDKKTVQARIGSGPIIELRNFDVAIPGPVQCVREIVRDQAAGSTLLPVYTAASYCTAPLSHRSGSTAMAIFKLESQRFSWHTWNDKEQFYYAIVPVALAPEDADRRLCQAGSCAAGGGR